MFCVYKYPVLTVIRRLLFIDVMHVIEVNIVCSVLEITGKKTEHCNKSAVYEVE
jgi:hypothetical protein